MGVVADGPAIGVQDRDGDVLERRGVLVMAFDAVLDRPRLARQLVRVDARPQLDVAPQRDLATPALEVGHECAQLDCVEAIVVGVRRAGALFELQRSVAVDQ